MRLKTRRLNKLFRKWQQGYGAQANHFVADGIVDEARWGNTSPKVLLLMREMSGWAGDLRAVLRWRIGEEQRPKYSAAWPEVAGCWAFGLQRASAGRISPFDTALEHWRHGLASAAVVLLKKLSGSTVARPGVLLAAAQRDAALIREELDIIQPDIVLCCGTFDVLRSILDIKSSTNSGGVVTNWKGLSSIPVFSTHHPNRAGELHYRDLVCQYQQYLQRLR